MAFILLAEGGGLPSRRFYAALQNSVGSNSTNSVTPYGRQTLALLSNPGLGFEVPDDQKKKVLGPLGLKLFSGGRRGIRTPEAIADLHAFQACAFDHSAIPPNNAAAV